MAYALEPDRCCMTSRYRRYPRVNPWRYHCDGLLLKLRMHRYLRIPKLGINDNYSPENGIPYQLEILEYGERILVLFTFLVVGSLWCTLHSCGMSTVTVKQ